MTTCSTPSFQPRELPWPSTRMAGDGVGSRAKPPAELLDSMGRIFARFDQQDSGNVSFGVQIDGQRYFVKTAGEPGSSGLPLRHAERVALLANAQRLACDVCHPVLTRFVGSCRSAWGPMLFYAFASGEHLHERRERREDPATAWQRFLHLPFYERIAVVRTLLDLHVALAAKGWVVGDFYDGCLIYDFATKRIAVFDLDNYRKGAYENTMGRMFGSTRFMAPEEFEKGCVIDERTTVFAMGRTMSILLGEPARAVADVACAEDPEDRHATVAQLAADFGATVSPCKEASP